MKEMETQKKMERKTKAEQVIMEVSSVRDFAFIYTGTHSRRVN